MSSTSTQSPAALIPSSSHHDSLADFVRWGLAQLDLAWQETEGCARLELPEEHGANFDGKSELTLALDPVAESAAEAISLDGRFCQWLTEQLRAESPVASVRPVEQPAAVNDVVSRLFDAYRVDDGQAHLGGCQLEDFAFLRLTFPATDSRGRDCVSHLFVAHDGSSVSDQLAETLGLLDVTPILDLPPRIDKGSLGALVAAGRRIAAQSCSQRDPQAKIVEPLATAIVWVKHAGGKLQFTIADATVELPFSGWAKLIEAPAYVSAASGGSGFHLAATDDGRIDLASEIAQCENSGRRVLRQELVTCSVTRKRVLAELTRTCPVTGEAALEEEFEYCTTCMQEVSRTALEMGICAGCRNLAKIRGDDPRLVWIVSEHKGLARWSRWKMAETSEVYIAQAASLMKRLLVVVDKESLSVRHLAVSSRFSSKWDPVQNDDFSQILL